MLLLVGALVLFILAGFLRLADRVQLVAIGLACWVLSVLIGNVHL